MKSKLTEEFISEVDKYISIGLTNQDVCNILEISENSFYRWINEGTEDLENNIDSLECKLVKTLKKAQTNFKAYHVRNITSASSNDWKASAWMLERKFNDEYGRVDRTKLSNDDDNGIQIQIVNDVPSNDK